MTAPSGDAYPITLAMLREGFQPASSGAATRTRTPPERQANPYAMARASSERAEGAASHARGVLSDEERGRIFALLVAARTEQLTKEDTDRGDVASSFARRVREQLDPLRRSFLSIAAPPSDPAALGVVGISNDEVARAGFDPHAPITRALLVENGVTVGDLVGTARVSMMALYQVGIATTLAHLLALGLTIDAIAVDRDLFSADDLVGVYNGTYTALRDAGVPMNGIDMAEAKLRYGDLVTLEFTFALVLDSASQRLAITTLDIRAMQLSVQQCWDLGITADMIGDLGITRLSEVAPDLGWDCDETKALFSKNLERIHT